MQVSLLILDTLDELGADEFKRFRWSLTQPVLDGCQPIRKGHLENADRQDTVSKMIDSYGEEAAVKVTIEILKRMNHNNTAEKLRSSYSGGSSAAQNPVPAPSSSSSSSSSSSGLTPAAGASVCAQGKSVIVAPNIQGTSSEVPPPHGPQRNRAAYTLYMNGPGGDQNKAKRESDSMSAG